MNDTESDSSSKKESVVFMVDETGHFVPTLVREILAFFTTPKKDRSKSGTEGKEDGHHRTSSKKSRRATNRKSI